MRKALFDIAYALVSMFLLLAFGNAIASWNSVFSRLLCGGSTT
jgi:hypothetical protein